MRAVANVSCLIMERIANAVDTFEILHGKKPKGLLLGAQDYLELRAYCTSEAVYDHMSGAEGKDSVWGIPVYVSSVTRRMECIVDSRDAIIFTRHLVTEDDNASKA